MAKGTNRDQGRETRWRRIIRQHARSKLTIRQFCRDNDLAESAFYFWRGELQRREGPQPQSQGRHARQEQRRRQAPRGPRQRNAGAEGASSQAAAPAFVPVSISPRARPDSAGIEIVLPGGARIHVAGGVERQALADVVAVLLEARTC
jgi:transposase-like protein